MRESVKNPQLVLKSTKDKGLVCVFTLSVATNISIQCKPEPFPDMEEQKLSITEYYNYL